MSDDIHPDEFGGTDEDSHLVPKRLPHLDHVGPMQSGSLRPFIGVEIHTGVDLASKTGASTVVRFEADVDEDATRIAAVLGALGYTATRVMADQGARDRWALAEVGSRYSLSKNEIARVNRMHAEGELDGYATTYIAQCICHKLAGKTLAQAMAEIAEVRS